MALNAVDGMLAREHGQKSRLGALLNELGDVVSDTALYLPLALVPGFSPPLVAVIVVLAALSEMTGVLAQTIGASRRYDGPMGKSDRAFVFGLVALLLALGVPPGSMARRGPGRADRAAARDRLEPLRPRVAGGRRVNEVLERIPRGPVLYVFAGVMGLLALSTILGALLARLRPDKDFRELNARIRSWWLMAVVFMLAILLSRAVSLVFMAFLSFLALKEYLSLIPTRRADRSVLLWAYLAVPLQYLWVWVDWYGMFIIFIPVYMFMLIPVRMVLHGQTEGFLPAAGTLHWGLMTTVFTLSHMAYLLQLPEKGGAAGASLVLFLVLVTQLNDVAQYTWGKLFGRHKVMPTVSPNKTYEGLLGGMATSFLLVLLLAPHLTPLTRNESLVAGFFLPLAGFLGDVSVSAIKRDIGVKDAGSLIPGHGGVLDRVNSLTFTAPLFFHFLRFLHF